MNSEARVAHVWRRLGFGPAPGDVEAGVAAGGASAVIDDLLARPATTLTDWHWPTDTRNPPVVEDMGRWVDQLWKLWMHSPGVVQERVSWILTGITVAGITDTVKYLDLKDHHNHLRAWPSSTYKALLTDVASGTAMQKYLNGTLSAPPHPNENLARELMELFSLGVTHPATGTNNYDENDVKEVARALTGYRWNGQSGPSSVWFDAAFWDTGDKTFLGAARGAAKLPDVIDAIASQDSFKYFVPKQMYRDLVGIDPSISTLHELAAVWGGDGDIAGLVNHIAHRPEFVADATVGNRLKSPVELMASCMRVLGFADVSQFSLYWTPSLMRQNPITPPDVSGWDSGWLHPAHIVSWSEMAYWLAWFDRGPSETQYPTPVAQRSPTMRSFFAEATTATATDMALRLAGLYEVPPSTREAVDAYVKAGTWDWQRACGTMQLVFNSPEFMVN
ncbi:MAG: hypothetical protein QOI61_1719 [Actinomycetota bacterium]